MARRTSRRGALLIRGSRSVDGVPALRSGVAGRCSRIAQAASRPGHATKVERF